MVKSPKKQAFTASTVTICDDVREEKSGKMILIGVYADVAIVKSFPALLPKLVFRFSGTINVAEPKEVSFQVIDDAGQKKADIHGPLPPTMKKGPNTFMFEMHSTVFEKPAVLSIYFGVDAAPTLSGQFSVRGPLTEEEEARMPQVA